jgi:histidyl-tRNA synthetase
MDKQFKYATKKNIGYAVIIGSKEMQEETCVIKNLEKGAQETVSQNELLKYFQKQSLLF